MCHRRTFTDLPYIRPRLQTNSVKALKASMNKQKTIIKLDGKYSKRLQLPAKAD